MDNHRKVVVTMGLFFGWLLTVPFNGPVLLKILVFKKYEGPVSFLAFSLSHALSFLVLGLLNKENPPWSKRMIWGNNICLAAGLLLLALPAKLSAFSLIAMGIGSSLFVVGWSKPFSCLCRKEGWLKTMAAVILLANIILLISTLLVNYISIIIIYLLLLVTLVAIYLILNTGLLTTESLKITQIRGKYPKGILLILTILIFAL